MKIFDIVFISAFAICYIGLLVVAKTAAKKLSYMWKLLYIIPAILGLVYISIWEFDICLIPIYISMFLVFIGFYKENERVRTIISGVSLGLTIITVPICILSSAYRVPNLLEQFDTGFDMLKEHYCLTDLKEIDFDGLYAKYAPEFARVNETHDQVEYTMLWHKFTAEFNDAHTGYQCDDKKISEQAKNRMYGNDYGFSTIELEDKSIVAVNVDTDSQAYKEGIHNGTKIISIDGIEAQDMKERVEYPVLPESDRENADFYRSFYIAGLGGDTINLEYQSDNGDINRVTLEKTGFYYDRLKDTLVKFDDGVKTGHLTWVNINEDTALFRIKLMMYDSDSAMETDYSEMESEIRDKLISLKEAGYKNIIIDLRNNGGGSPHMVVAVAKLFDKEGEHFYCGGGEIDRNTGNFVKDSDGKYVLTDSINYNGENLWGHGKVVVLVNGMCASGGDHMAMLFDRMDNAKVIGYTKSNGVGQGTNGVSLKTGSLQFSAVPTMDENGEILIDAGKDGISKMHIDEKVPVTMDTVSAVFDNGEDYLLNYVCENEF